MTRTELESDVRVATPVVCPCCGGRFAEFLPFGMRRRPGAQCPDCRALERHRLLWLYFEQRTNLFAERLRVLHVAPEACLQRRLQALPNLEYVSIDLQMPTAMARMDVTSLAWADQTFDVIVCSHVLEHIVDDRLAMRELSRVLKPDGWAILQVPIDLRRERTYENPAALSPDDRLREFGQRDHVRIYGRDYVDRLRDSGFDVRVDAFVRELDAGQCRTYGLTDHEDIHCCTKAAPTGTAGSRGWRGRADRAMS